MSNNEKTEPKQDEFEATDTELAGELYRQIQGTKQQLTRFRISERYLQRALAKDKLAGKTDTMLELGRTQENIKETVRFLSFLVEWNKEVEERLGKETEKDEEL